MCHILYNRCRKKKPDQIYYQSDTCMYGVGNGGKQGDENSLANSMICVYLVLVIAVSMFLKHCLWLAKQTN